MNKAVQIGGDHSLEAIERAHIQGVLARVPKLEEAARVLGIDPATLYRKRKGWGMMGKGKPKVIDVFHPNAAAAEQFNRTANLRSAGDGPAALAGLNP